MELLRHTAFLLVLFALALQARAQPRLGGFVEYDNLTYFESPLAHQVNGRNQVIVQGELRHEVNAKANVFGSVELRYDQADPVRNRVYLDEAYVNLYYGRLDLRLGKQIFAWGRADGFNPTNNLTAWDYSDVLDTENEQLGLVSARAVYYAGSWSAEAVLAPSFTPSTLPGVHSRWWPELPATVANPVYPAAGPRRLNARYRYAAPRLPDEGLASTQYALRLSGLLRGWDVSVSWFDGYDDLPALHVTPDVDAALTTATVTIEPAYHRRRAAGVDFATTFGALGVRGEAAYYLTEDWSGTDPAIDDPYLQYAVGADYTFDGLLVGKDLFLLAEWVQELHLPDRSTVYRFTDLNHLFRRSVFARADLALGAFTDFVLDGTYNVATRDWWIQPGLVWSVTDGLALRADLDLTGGPDDAFFGSFRENRRVQLRVKYSF